MSNDFCLNEKVESVEFSRSFGRCSEAFQSLGLNGFRFLLIAGGVIFVRREADQGLCFGRIADGRYCIGAGVPC